MIKMKYLTGVAAAGFLILGAANAYANPLSIFNNDDVDTEVNATATATAGGSGGSGSGGDGGLLGGGGNGTGGSANQTNTATAISESYNSPYIAVTHNELSNVAGDNNNDVLLVLDDNQGTGSVSWNGNAMQTAAGVMSQASNTAQAGASQSNASVTAVANSSFSFH